MEILIVLALLPFALVGLCLAWAVVTLPIRVLWAIGSCMRSDAIAAKKIEQGPKLEAVGPSMWRIV